jgi:hypothetical protein
LVSYARPGIVYASGFKSLSEVQKSAKLKKKNEKKKYSGVLSNAQGHEL